MLAATLAVISKSTFINLRAQGNYNFVSYALIWEFILYYSFYLEDIYKLSMFWCILHHVTGCPRIMVRLDIYYLYYLHNFDLLQLMSSCFDLPKKIRCFRSQNPDSFDSKVKRNNHSTSSRTQPINVEMMGLTMLRVDEFLAKSLWPWKNNPSIY